MIWILWIISIWLGVSAIITVWLGAEYGYWSVAKGAWFWPVLIVLFIRGWFRYKLTGKLP